MIKRSQYKPILILFILFGGIIGPSYSQEIPIYSQFLSNPYLYNPAYGGIEEKPVLILTHRRQWTGINDSPVTSNLTFHLPVSSGVNLGTLITTDKAGIFRSTTAQLSVNYLLPLGWNHYISFGLAGGAGFQNVDLSTGVNINDPALATVLENGTYLEGRAGIAYHFENLNVGFSLPKLFSTQKFPSESFQSAAINGLENFIASIDYLIYFASDNHVFQPYGLYRSYEGYASQWEAGGVFHIGHVIWVGGFYRESFGYGGLVGITSDGRFSFGYSIDIPATKYNGVNLLSHEFQLEVGLVKNSNNKSRRRGRRGYRRRSNPKKESTKEFTTFYSTIKPDRPEKPRPEPQKADEPLDNTIIAEQIPTIEIEGRTTSQSDTVKSAPRFKTTAVPSYLLGDQQSETDVLNSIPEAQRPDKLILLSNSTGESTHYVIADQFNNQEAATAYINELRLDGFSGNMLHDNTQNIYYVYVYIANDPNDAIGYRNQLREDKFKDAIYLLIQ